MSFFNPSLLWFALGGAVPIIIHLLHRQKYRRVRWAAMEFLLAALKKTQKRLRIENLLLLLVRILVMVLLALAIARPFFREAPLEALATSDALHLFVIDNSYSMGYKKAQETCLDVAKRTAEKKIDELNRLTDQDRFSVVLMSNYPDVWVPESNKKDLVRQRIGEIRLSHYGTSAYATFQRVHEVLRKSKNQQKNVYVFTDFQRNAWLSVDEREAKQFAELTKALSSKDGARVYLVDVGFEGADNRAIVDLRCETPVVTLKSPARFTGDLCNWSTVSYPAVAVSFYVDGALLKTEQVALPAGATVPLPPFKVDFMEPGAHIVEAAIETDFLDVDDRRAFALEVKDGLSGVLVDGEPGNQRFSSETDYLRVALDSAYKFKLDRQVTPEMFEAENLEKQDFVALCNVQSLAQEKVERLERFVRGGGGLLISLGGKVDRGWYNEFLWKDGKGLLPASLMEIDGAPPDQEPRMPVRIQRYSDKHPIFATFQKGLKNQPRGLLFYQYFRMEKYDAGSVVANLDDNFSTPLWLEKTFGDGKVLLFNNTVDDGWNLQAPGRIPFVVMMINACEQLASRPVGRWNLFIGDFIAMQMTADKFQKTFALETPVEGQVSISPEPPSKETTTFWVKYPAPPPPPRDGAPRVLENQGLQWAGRYTLDKPGKRDDERPVATFAANFLPRVPTPDDLIRAEGNLDRIGEDEIRKRMPDFKFEVIGKVKPGERSADLKPPPAGLWTYLLYLLLGLLATESILAWLFGRSQQ